MRDPDNNRSNLSMRDSLEQLSERRYNRRDFLRSSTVVGAALILPACTESKQPIPSKSAAPLSRFDFAEVEHGIDEHHHVASDHIAEVLIRWGDPIFTDGEAFDVNAQSKDKQLKQFGYNNDYIGFIALDEQASRALLCVNHEYPINGLMFPQLGRSALNSITPEMVAIAQAATGASVVEIERQQDGVWRVNRESSYNRRISALETEFEIRGPARGHSRLKTKADPKAERIVGTLNNCAGGITPWHSYLSCEENFNYHFLGDLPKGHAEASNHQRYNVPTNLFHWGKHDKRFDLASEPNEANRFGWVVEIDPLKPQSTPVKRTALGRFKHEGAENVIANDGRLVIYMGDDQRFEYLYKFISQDAVDLQNAEANRDLLDHGTLYVAVFHESGSYEWRALTHDDPRLQPHFASQADVLIEARAAADHLQATPMDRPEDVVPNKETGKVYVMLSNNTKRKEANVVNPRAKNRFGHILELSETEQDFAALKGRWEMLVKCGDPDDENVGAKWNERTSENGWFASPDNGTFDPSGRLWVSSDQGGKVRFSGTVDGLWALETEGEERGSGRMFYRCPNGAELSGPIFSDDGESLFVSVQHPGDDANDYNVRIANATSMWPDFEEGVPPRPSVVQIRRKLSGKVG